MNLFWFVIFLFLFLPVTVFADSEVDELIEKGLDSYRENNFEQATYYFDKILEIEPNHTDALEYKGSILLQLGKYEEAMPYFDQVLEIDPNHIGALIDKGLALIKFDKAKESVFYFAKVAKIDPHYDLKQLKLHNERSFYVPIDGFVEITVHNSQGSLTTHIITPYLKVFDFDIVNNVIEQMPIEKIVNRNGQNFKVHKLTIVDNIIDDSVEGYSTIRISFEKIPTEYYETVLAFSNDIEIIQSVHPQFPVETGDTITYIYTIFRPVE